jgi:hypothetical protein
MINRVKGTRRPRKAKAALNGKSHGTNGHANGKTPVEPLESPLSAVSDGSAVPEPGRSSDNGRFAPGNKFGKGNPFSRKLAAARQAICDAVSSDDLRGMVADMVQASKGGDVAAAQLLFSYLAGKPAAAPDPDKLDVAEFQLLAANPSVAETVRAKTDSVPAGAAATLLRMVMSGRGLINPPKGEHINTDGFTVEEISASIGVLKHLLSVAEQEEFMDLHVLDRQLGELRKVRCKRSGV